MSMTRDRGALPLTNARLAIVQTRVLVASAVDDIHALAACEAGKDRIEARLALLDYHTIGRKSVSCRVLAEQVQLWYDTYDSDRALALSREAVAQHAAAAVFGRTNGRLDRTAKSPIGSLRSH